MAFKRFYRILVSKKGPTRPGENETIAIWRALEEFSGIKKKDVHVVPKIKKSLKVTTVKFILY